MPKKKITLEEFEAQHPDKVWTEKSARALAAGEKKCSQCYETLPLEMFTKYISQHGKKRFCSHCYECSLKYRQPSIRKKRAQCSEREKQLRREYYEERHTEPKTRAQAYYQRAKAENSAMILETMQCDVCGGSHARYFWRNVNLREWSVLHKGCLEQAKREGIVPIGARLRHKRELKGMT